MVIKIAVVGAAGRMGQIMVQGLSEYDDLSIVTVVDVLEVPGATNWVTSVTDLSANDVDVVVDFSSAAGATATLRWCAVNGVAAVIGATGLSPEQVRSAVDENASVVLAANFSIGAILAERFAAQAAPYFERVEIIEMHHDQKRDAPSGTSLATASAMAVARRAAQVSTNPDPTVSLVLEGARGALGEGDIPIHSVRLPGLVAHQEVIFGRPGEGLTIRHDSYDRSSFVSGVALAVRSVRNRPGLTVGLDELI